MTAVRLVNTGTSSSWFPLVVCIRLHVTVPKSYVDTSNTGAIRTGSIFPFRCEDLKRYHDLGMTVRFIFNHNETHTAMNTRRKLFSRTGMKVLPIWCQHP